VRGTRIEIERDGISLSPEDVGNLPIQISKVFLCPDYSFVAAVQRLNAIIDHAALP
jgi:hypothetical protein